MRPTATARSGIALALMLAGFGLWRLAPGLGHPSIHNWDESAHQAATRGTFESFFRPHIYPVALYPNPPENWMGASVFLHKPTAPFWFGALMMRLTGVTPLALRLGSLFGALAAALCILALLRRVGEPLFGALGGAVFLALPFGHALCHGYMFGDATDCPLAGWVSLSVLLLVHAVERDDARLAVAAGASTGVAYLCKTALGLAPLGIAAAFYVLGAVGLSRPLRLRLLLLFSAALLLVAVPWNLYTAFAFPADYRYEAQVTLNHLFTTEFRQWVRPWDGLLNEVNQTELHPLPPALALVALLAGTFRALKRREVAVVALVLWVLPTWLVLSVAKAKVPATAWGAVPGVVALIALLAAEARRSAVALGLFIGAGLSGLVLAAFPLLGRVALWLPPCFAQTRTRPVLLVGLLLAVALAALLALGRRLLGARAALTPLALPAALMLLAGAVGATVRAQQQAAQLTAGEAAVAPMREVGQALDRGVPAQSVLFLALERDPPCCFSLQDLIFWSGKGVYRRAPDLATAATHGLHPYLVSTAAEPYAEVPGVPAFAEARAYDLLAPKAPPGLPADAIALALPQLPNLLGVAAGPRDADHDIWTFFVRSGASRALQVRFEGRDGKALDVAASVDTYGPASKRSVPAPWLLASTLGPPRATLRAVKVGEVALPLSLATGAIDAAPRTPQ